MKKKILLSLLYFVLIINVLSNDDGETKCAIAFPILLDNMKISIVDEVQVQKLKAWIEEKEILSLDRGALLNKLGAVTPACVVFLGGRELWVYVDNHEKKERGALTRDELAELYRYFELDKMAWRFRDLVLSPSEMSKKQRDILNKAPEKKGGAQYSISFNKLNNTKILIADEARNKSIRNWLKQKKITSANPAKFDRMYPDCIVQMGEHIFRIYTYGKKKIRGAVTKQELNEFFIILELDRLAWVFQRYTKSEPATPTMSNGMATSAKMQK
ncbi:uncharacterized protein YggL (DUF469 family) [Ereboglobus sp. PH5-10]|uniref:hypothetical protein n=1 Tax=Ereboglobus sp. PH5-10 TaxID=2940629 RepID=UPI002406AAB5|nr:hypothetical protein [Ereboglobus sp. PH5-10]MDF9827638.1 uncharacterized protein YggL (DUF469 family) [Ereboglobus sp. PH5-10]